MIAGRVRFDGIALAHLVVKFVRAEPRVFARAAFVDNRTGRTHGETQNRRWSPAVLKKLEELQRLMELDLARLHFSDVSEHEGEAYAAPGGLLEHITAGEEGVPSI